LNRNWRESRREEERLRGRINNGALASRLNNGETQWQQFPQPQIWLRRQKMPQQLVQTGLALMEGVERTNVVIMHSNQRVGFTQYNSYAMDVDQENRNCYNCRGFGHLARNCRNRRIRNRIGEGRRLEYSSNENNGQRRIEGGNRQDNLNGE